MRKLNLQGRIQSSARHEKSCMNKRGPSRKAKYYLVTDSGEVPWGKVEKNPGRGVKRTWNPMFTNRQSELRRDVVLFVERSGELLYMARLSIKKIRSRREIESEKGESEVIYNRPETEWPIHVQDEGRVKSIGGPNWLSLKRHRMRCG